MLGLRPSSRLVEAYFYFAGRDLIREKPGTSSPTFVRLNGGLGNQLFQLAAGAYVSQKINTDLVLDLIGLEILRKRAISTPRKYELAELRVSPKLADNSEIAKLSKIAMVIRRQGETPMMSLTASLLRFMPKPAFENSGVLLEGDGSLTDIDISLGIFPKYLVGHWADYRVPLALGEDFKRQILEGQPGVPDLRKRIRDANGAVVHVRRGDFVSRAAKTHNILPEDYYLKGIEALGLDGQPTFVFSDDISWCRQEFRHFNTFHFVEPEPQHSSLDYLVTMSESQSYLIPNSSFSWWAAWLGGDDGKRVVRPKGWVRKVDGSNVYPPSWISLD